MASDEHTSKEGELYRLLWLKTKLERLVLTQRLLGRLTSQDVTDIKEAFRDVFDRAGVAFGEQGELVCPLIRHAYGAMKQATLARLPDVERNIDDMERSCRRR